MKDSVKQDSALVIFARHPENGRVKTRLARTLGAEKATEFYRLCAAHLFREAAKLPPEIRRYIYGDGTGDEDSWRAWAGTGFDYAVQSTGSLGRRLENALATRLSGGAGRVVIVASDVPDISAEVIAGAFRSLDNHEIVIGPCHDGGFYLIGMKRLHRGIFGGIPWSTGRVYARTLANIGKLGISPGQLPPLQDIDTEADLRRWAGTLVTPASHPWGALLQDKGIIDYQGYPDKQMTSATEHRLPDFNAVLAEHRLSVKPAAIRRLWVNITSRCNQACTHCHVGASPARRDCMPRPVIDRCLEVLAQNSGCTELDITGGAPELHPDFAYLVTGARKLGKHVLVRHNITVIFDGAPRGGDTSYLPGFYAANGVEIIASLPHYRPAAVDGVRGGGVFDKSIRGIRLLNGLGYGQENSGLVLNLVHNADGPLSPADRARLEAEYRSSLAAEHGIIFNRLYAVTNMPIKRYYRQLRQAGTYRAYMERLVGAFSAGAVDQLACRSLISVGYDGRIYDCDFNQMLGLPVTEPGAGDIFNADFRRLAQRRIRFGAHCFGCTAGGGSH